MMLRKCIIGLFLVVTSMVAAKGYSSFAPFPKAADSYWHKKIPQEMCQDYVRLGDVYIGKPWHKIPSEVFAEFRKTGNRTNYEESSFTRRKQFVCLVMAEIMEHRGRFMADIRAGLHYFLEEEPWWGLPAHYPKECPDSALQVVDLFNAETSSMLAWTTYMLGRDIDKAEAGLTRKVQLEIERRFILPTLRKKHGWMKNVNNWNTWITSNFIESVLVCESSRSSDRSKALRLAESCLQVFLKGYPDDGGCEEGVGYWDRAGASFFESKWMFDAAEPTLQTDDSRLALTPKEEEKVAAMGRFITTMHIDSLSFVNFSDAQVHITPHINILFPYGAWLAKHKDKSMQEDGRKMMQFAAYIAHRYNYFQNPSKLFLKSGNWPSLGRELMLLSMLSQLRETPASQPQTTDAYLNQSQVMVASNGAWFVAAKGGTNGESHNHNDVGTFVVYYRDKPVIIDLGRDTYTSKTFGPHRYEQTNNRSLYHNVPFINGFEQHAGREYHATQVCHFATDTASIFSLDIAQAYPKEAGVEKWQRMITLDRTDNRVYLQEEYMIENKDSLSSDLQITLMTYGCPVMQRQGKILLAKGLVALCYDASQLDASWQKVSMTDGIMKRQWKDCVYRITLHPKKGNSYANYWFEGRKK